MTFQEKFKLLKPVVWLEGLPPDAQPSQEQLKEIGETLLSLLYQNPSELLEREKQQEDLITQLFELGVEMGYSPYLIDFNIKMRLYPVTVHKDYIQLIQLNLNHYLRLQALKEQYGERAMDYFFWELDNGIRFLDWSDELKSYSWPFAVFELPEELKDYFLSRKVVDEVDEQYVLSLQNFLDQLPKEIYPDKFFIKLNSCSPKDIIAHKFKVENYPTLDCANAREIFALLDASIRIAREVSIARNTGAKLNLIIRPYLSLDWRNEFRVFVFRNRIIGVSQMSVTRRFNYTPLEKEAIMSKAHELIKKIEPHLGHTYSIDMYLEGESICQSKPILVEVNPFYWGLNPVLFAGKVFDESLQVLED